jgi:hypothetical protein
VILKINEVITETKEITLAGGTSETVVFIVSQDEADTYLVDVNGLIGSFVAREPASVSPSASTVSPPESTASPPASSAEPGWGLIGGIIAAFAMAVAIPLALRWRRRRDKQTSIDEYRLKIP